MRQVVIPCDVYAPNMLHIEDLDWPTAPDWVRIAKRYANPGEVLKSVDIHTGEVQLSFVTIGGSSEEENDEKVAQEGHKTCQTP